MSDADPRVGVVGHVECITFAVVDRLPGAGEIVHARETFELAAGGGAVAAAQLAMLAGSALLITAFGEDDLGTRAAAELGSRGVEVHAARRPGARTRRGWTYLDGEHERTITILDPRIVPHGGDPLPWDRCGQLDAVYFTGGDVAALRAARAARVLVATARCADVLLEAGVRIDVLIASASDSAEALDPSRLDPSPGLVVRTAGEGGGAWSASGGASGGWEAADPPGAPVDSYGCGDAFAAALTYGVARGQALDQALDLAARCGASIVAGRGPYGAMLAARE